MLMPVLHVSMSLPNVKRTKKISSHCWTKIGEILVKKNLFEQTSEQTKKRPQISIKKNKTKHYCSFM